MRAVRVHRPGGPEAMRLDELPTPEPGPGQALVRITAAGVNYVDIYQRRGEAGLPPPFTLGREGAGVVAAVGPGVAEVAVGRRVAWAAVQGSYATHGLFPAARLAPIPDEVNDRQAAAAILQGMTAHFLTRTCYPIQPGDAVLVHAAAGGMGQLLCQMAKGLGARVFGTVGSDAKAEVARAAGADEVIVYTRRDFAAEVRRLTDGRGVEVVYDGVGRDTFQGSLDALALRGCLALYGAASGPVPPVDSATLAEHGSLFLTRPRLADYTATRDELLQRADRVFRLVGMGLLRLRVEGTYPLARAAEAHAALEGRRTTGKLLLLP